MRNTIIVWLVLGACAQTLLACHPAVAAELTPFNPQDREVIDQRVLQGPDQRTEQPKQAFYGTLAGWGIARTPLKPEQERELALAEHQAILESCKTSPAPPLAVGVLKRLTNHLPEAAPNEFEYTLTIIETREFRSWTVGGGFLYLSRPMYEALTDYPEHAEDRLAFVLAHEMGHIVRKHCRVAYQLLKLEAFTQRESWDEQELFKLKKNLKRPVEFTGGRLRFLHEPHQEYEADLFAAHLCRNAGFDGEAGRDVLRQGVLCEEQGGDPRLDPVHALLSNVNPASEKLRPSASDRLRQLCFDRDGVVREPPYGLWEFDPQADQWVKPAALRLTQEDRVVLLVHGMDSTLSKCYLDLARELARDPHFRGHRVLGFQYPGDASLTRVGEFLHRELSQACDTIPKIDFVCHSAGGLVARYYAEVKGGPFQRFILQATPNHGSDWARLRPVVEMKQFVKDLRSGYSQAIENAILDGQGQIAHDLQPGSLFLNFLNDRQADRGQYAILRGQKLGGTRLLVMDQSMELGRSLMAQRIESSKAPKILRERAVNSLEKLQLPEEVRRGDLVVSTKSAELIGVPEVQTFKLHHGQLSRDPEAIAATLAILKAEK